MSPEFMWASYATTLLMITIVSQYYLKAWLYGRVVQYPLVGFLVPLFFLEVWLIAKFFHEDFSLGYVAVIILLFWLFWYSHIMSRIMIHAIDQHNEENDSDEEENED